MKKLLFLISLFIICYTFVFAQDNSIVKETQINLEVTPDKFKYFTLRNGDKVFAYPIEIFFSDVPKYNPAFSEIINTISFEFRSNKLMARDEIRLFPER